MDSQNNILIGSSNGEETDGNTVDERQFMNYENSVFRFRKQKEKENTQDANMEEQANEELANRMKAIKAERLIETIRSHNNKMSMWQSFPASNDQYAVVFCYERDYLKAWMNLKAVSFDEHYHLTLTDREIKLTTEENKTCCKRDMEGMSHTDVCRTYRVPREMDYLRAVWHQTGDVLEICVPWSTPIV